MKIYIPIAAAILAAALPAALQAETVSTRVSYGDLNLTSDAGMHTFKARLHEASRNVCGTGSGDVSSEMAATQCQRDAYAKALHDVSLRTAPAYASR